MTNNFLGDRISLVYRYRGVEENDVLSTAPVGEIIVGTMKFPLFVKEDKNIEIMIYPGLIEIAFLGTRQFDVQTADFIFTNHSRDFPKNILKRGSAIPGFEDGGLHGWQGRYSVDGNIFSVKMENMVIPAQTRLEFQV